MTVVSFFNNSNAINPLRESGYGDADFDVLTSPVSYEDNSGLNIQIPGKKALYRDDNGSFIGFHSSKYKPVGHKDMIDTARNILERSELNLEGIREDIRVSETGEMCYVQHDVPNHSVDTPDGDTSSLQFLHLNSTNGIWPYHASVGSLQSACLNKQIFLSNTAGIYRARHTQALNIDHGANMINKTVEVLINQNEIWCKWYNTDVSFKEALYFFLQAANAASLLKMSHEERLEAIDAGKVKNSNVVYMIRKFLSYQDKLGKNLWAVYNTLTDWSTHYGSESTKVSTRKNAADENVKFIKRSERVRETLNYLLPKVA